MRKIKAVFLLLLCLALTACAAPPAKVPEATLILRTLKCLNRT